MDAGDDPVTELEVAAVADTDGNGIDVEAEPVAAAEDESAKPGVATYAQIGSAAASDTEY